MVVNDGLWVLAKEAELTNRVKNPKKGLIIGWGGEIHGEPRESSVALDLG